MRLIILAVCLLGVVSGADDVKCSDCHTTDPTFSHPVGIVPSMKVPAWLPLEAGRLTCNTCHVDPGARNHMEKRPDPMLRRSTGLCQQCHDGARTLRSRMHGSSLTRAHLRWPDRDTTHVDESTTCQACHDGTIAGDGEGSSHRVGVRVEGRRGMRPTSMLPDEVRLFDGRVGCGSCHNPYSGRKGLPALDNRGSRLCFSCHNK